MSGVAGQNYNILEAAWERPPLLRFADQILDQRHGQTQPPGRAWREGRPPPRADPRALPVHLSPAGPSRPLPSPSSFRELGSVGTGCDGAGLSCVSTSRNPVAGAHDAGPVSGGWAVRPLSALGQAGISSARGASSGREARAPAQERFWGMQKRGGASGEVSPGEVLRRAWPEPRGSPQWAVSRVRRLLRWGNRVPG